MPILYRTSATATGGRTGHARSADGILDVALTTPKELGGPGGSATNPEQLFAAGYAACFLGALKYVANQEQLKVPDDAAVTAHVGIGPREDGGGFGLEVGLQLSLPGVDRAKAEELMRKADVVCPYSHLARHGLKVDLGLA
jgi:Ohr subfamily peroxiredoxin